MITDGDLEDLARLVESRRQLQRALAIVLRRVGHAHPKRAEVNRRRATHRKRLRTALRSNADRIAATVSHIFSPRP